MHVYETSGSAAGAVKDQILEPDTLISSLKQRSDNYKQLSTQFSNLKKGFQSIVDLENFKGMGANNIKAFYRAQIEVINEWQNFIKMQREFLDDISNIMKDHDLDEETFVQGLFLENDLHNGYTRAVDMVETQKESLKGILDSISDIISLKTFSSETFEKHMKSANKKRKKTLEDMEDLDKRLVEEYSASEQQQYLVTGMFKALLDATSQNGQISPANFDQIAFENSDAYSVRDEVHEYNDQYFEAKEVQKEIRKAKAEQERIENMAWYEKVWEYGSTFVGEISGYYDYVRVKDGIDPITGEKLSEAERITSGAFAAATYVPFVGWGAKLGKGVKGAYALGKTMRMTNATIDTYKTAKTMDYLHKAEYGIYGLTSANGFSEYITGKDMFGNELSEEKRKEGLDMAMSFWGGRVAGVGVKKASTHLNVNQVEKNRKVSTGAKGTGKVHRSEIDEVIKNDYDKNGNLINRSIVPKGYESVEDFLKVVDDTTIKRNLDTIVLKNLKP
ncbi:T7SS effector LXG polymorphic toxin [Virgibacillus sp. 179-BFC.A HS]|uniref:T7SS effector LXG polymorphic toxin n=1 Tax=Tigheibacillus jepli TaxID=3035914 RepID=A0ABU5CEC9_9BACI|nr:T7SS effector LXG polymorphic toxin [Virgibacillus sp. 179-BFC.A HS]MDY0404689.1 T7SS effector LXG polymorphic toxin [Virgibacillus sp. 179-BFC.A HS]